MCLTNVQYGEGHLVPRGPRQEPPFSATPGAQGPKPLFVKEVSVFGVQKLCAKTKGLFKLNCLPRQGYIRRTKSRHIFQTQLLTDESISVGSYETRSVSAVLK